MKTLHAELSIGMRNQQVWVLKIKLGLIGYDLENSYPLELFDTLVSDAVRDFQKEKNLPTTGIADLDTIKTLDRTVEESSKFAVFGRVIDADAKPLPNAIVSASARDVAKNSGLNKVTTDSLGHYVIFYNRDQFSRSEKASADLLLSVTNHPEYTPDIIYNAKHAELVNLAPSDIEYLPPSEYENLLSDITPLLENVIVLNTPQAGSLEKLIQVVNQSANRSNDPKKNDLMFMRQELGALVEQFDALVDAIRLSTVLKNKFGVAFLYGLVRQNLSSEASELLNTTKLDVVTALDSAFSNNVIPLYLKKQELNFLIFLQKLSINHQTREATTKENSTLGDLLRLSGVAKKAQGQYAKAVYEQQGTSENFYDLLVSDYELSNTQVNKINQTLALSQLAAGHAPMVKAMQSVVNNENIKDERALVKLELKDWEKLIEGRVGTGYPIDTKGSNAREKNKNYAKQIKRVIEEKYLTSTIAYRLPALASGDVVLEKDLTMFFEKNPKFDFDKNSISQYFSRDANIRGLQNAQRVETTLLQTQRLIKVVGNEQRFEKIAPLIKAGFSSASQIASISQQAFINSMSGAMTETTALEVHSLSSSVSINSEVIKARFRENVNPLVPAVTPPLIDPDRLPDIFDGSPDRGLAEFFGSLNSCACEHCQSAYSPAAYYVDLLNELKRTNDSSGALSELFKRRRDLENIQLSCSNTNTVVPYIDLVNEVLESTIIDGDYENQTGDTGMEQAELAARWEYQNDLAYTKIFEAELNWAPIFEPDFVQANALLDYFKINTAEILEFFGEPDSDAYTEACITLGVSKATADIFTSASVSNHGLSFKLTEFIQQSGLTYEEIEQLLALRWLDPEGTIEIRFNPENSCDIDNAVLIGIDNVSADKIWRFLRLNTALPWSIEALGSALVVASDWAEKLEPDAENLDRLAFTLLASLYKLAKYTGNNVSEVATWFSLVVTVDSAPVQTSQRLNAIANLHNLTVDEISVVAELMGLSLELSPEGEGEEPFTPVRAIDLSDVLTLITDLGIDVYQLRWVLTNEDTAPALFEPKTEDIEKFVNNLWSGGKKLRFQLGDLESAVENVEERAEQIVQLHTAADAYVISQLANYLSSSDGIVLSILSTHFSESDYSLEVWREFLTDTSGAISSSLYSGLRQYSKALALHVMFDLSLNLLKSQLFLDSGLVGTDTEIIEFGDWLAFAKVASLNKQFSQWENPLITFVDDTDINNIESRTGWSRDVVQVFLESSLLDIRLSEPLAYQKLAKLFNLMKRLDSTPLDVIGFIEMLNNQNYAMLSNFLDTAGKRKLGESSWFDVITPINNVIREQKRDVLVNYLEYEVPPEGVGKFANTSEIYAYFLIDPEMSSCRHTSRIKNAISAVQLYIQRIRMGLEAVTSSSLGPAFNQEWEWRKNYRVWEANRKVFLYPENYIFPELRDDQTVFFKEFVSKLLQEEINEDTTERAVLEYLEKLEDVSRLDIRAIYEEEYNFSDAPPLERVKSDLPPKTWTPS